jgi:hypothetical protein
VVRILRSKRIEVDGHLVEVPAGCSREVDIQVVEKQRYSVRDLDDFNRLVDESKRRIPFADTFLGAHSEFLYARECREGMGFLNNYLGVVPDGIFEEVQKKVGVQKDG